MIAVGGIRISILEKVYYVQEVCSGRISRGSSYEIDV